MMASSLVRLFLVLSISSHVVTALLAEEHGKGPISSTATSDPNVEFDRLVTASDRKVLANLPCIKIVAESTDQDAEAAGITQNVLKTTVLVAVKNKLPRLQVDDSCKPFLHVSLVLHRETTASGPEQNFCAGLTLEMNLLVTINHNGRLTVAPVWAQGAVLWGPTVTARRQITEALEGWVTEFAGKYYEDGNP
jgi:hypothetical protein